MFEWLRKDDFYTQKQFIEFNQQAMSDELFIFKMSNKFWTFGKQVEVT